MKKCFLLKAKNALKVAAEIILTVTPYILQVLIIRNTIVNPCKLSSALVLIMIGITLLVATIPYFLAAKRKIRMFRFKKKEKLKAEEQRKEKA